MKSTCRSFLLLLLPVVPPEFPATAMLSSLTGRVVRESSVTDCSCGLEDDGSSGGGNSIMLGLLAVRMVVDVEDASATSSSRTKGVALVLLLLSLLFEAANVEIGKEFDGMSSGTIVEVSVGKVVVVVELVTGGSLGFELPEMVVSLFVVFANKLWSTRLPMGR